MSITIRVDNIVLREMFRSILCIVNAITKKTIILVGPIDWFNLLNSRGNSYWYLTSRFEYMYTRFEYINSRQTHALLIAHNNNYINNYINANFLCFHLSQGYDEKIHSSEVEISKSVSKHLNLSLARGTLSQSPSDLIDILPDAASYIVRDFLPGLLPLTRLLPMWQEALNSEEYEQCVLLTLLQVLRAVKYLYCNGIVHRDLGIDTLFAISHGSDCIIKLGGFQYSLYRPGPLSATTFVYAFHELHWLGGVDTRLPPEIMDTPENVHTLDYAHTDCFAIGCLIYDLVTGVNPFDDNPRLVYVGYSDDDLPHFPVTTKLSTHLQTLAHLLLRRDPHRRLGVSDALLLVQSMLWLPNSWIEESASKSNIEEHLLILKGSLLATIAKLEEGESIPLELVLKAEFLSSCSPSDLVRAYAVFSAKA